MRIVLIGTHSVGKTTLVNALMDDERFKETGYEIRNEVIRKCVREHGLPINEQGTIAAQNMFLDASIDNMKGDNFIADRGVIDVMAYTMQLNCDGKEEHLNRALRFIESNPDIVYCYIPIEAKLDCDGFRSSDETYRNNIDKCIWKLARKVKNLRVVCGPTSLRVNTILEIINNF